MNHTMRRHLGATAAISAALALGLTACSGAVQGSSGATSSAGASNITLASVYGNSNDPFWTTLGCGAKTEAKNEGVNLKEFASTSTDTSAFNSNFSSAQLANPSGILVNPLNPNQFISQYQTLMSKGVPVVTINSSNPPAQYKVVGTDTKPDFLKDVAGLVADGSGKLAIINGFPGLVPVDSRLNPVVDAITAAHSGLQKLDPVYTSFDVTKATSAVSSLIIAHPDLKVIVAADGPDGQATAAAVKTAGKAGQITVIALDATPTEVTALKDGSITALVAQSPEQIGAQQVKTLVDYIKGHPNGGTVPASADMVGVPQKLLTKDNVDSSDSKAWIYQSTCTS